MDFVVAVPTYHRPGALERFLEALAEQTLPPNRVFVVGAADDPGTDRVISDAREDWPGDAIRYETQDPEGNLQSVRNRILSATDADVVCFLDDDTVPESSWFRTVVETFERSGATVVGGPAIRARADLTPTERILRSPEPQNVVTDSGLVTDLSHRWIPPEPVDVDVCRGANMAIERSAIEAVGGFDPGYGGPGMFEEWDALTRIRARGHRIRYHPDATVHHLETREGGTRTGNDRPGTYWYARNSLRFRRRNAANPWQSLASLAVTGGGGGLPSVAGRLLSLGSGDWDQRHWLLGYLHGLMYEY